MATHRVLALLKIRPEEARMAGLVALFFGLIEVERAVADSTADALFFRRFGVEYLPYMYVMLGLIAFAASLSYVAVVPRLDKRRLFFSFLLVIGLLLLVERAAIPLEWPVLYPLLWLTINVAATLLGTLIWTTASEICDTRQAKRLFPIFVSAGILGGLLGSVVTGPAARLVGTDNLIVVCVLLLAASALLFRGMARRYFPLADRPRARPALLSDIRAGYDFVKGAPLFQLLAITAVLFSILWFSISFPFGRAASAAFSSEADLAGFLGLFRGLSSLLMFLVALFIANRLYARIGIVNSLVLLPLTYLFGFALFAANFALSTAVVARLAQVVVLSGIGDGAYSAFFNVVPAELRAQVRAFDAGIPTQIGTMLSGLLLLLAARLPNNMAIFIMGMIAAVLCTAVVWQMRRRYVEALVAALHAGRLDIFIEGHRLFAGLAQDLEATRTLVTALSDPKPTTQKLAAEMLARTRATSAVPALIQRVGAANADVRLSIVRALGQLADRRAARPVVGRLEDESSAVRSAALEALPSLCAPGDPDILHLVRRKLTDPDLSVRLQAAISLARMGEARAALRALEGFVHEADDEPARIRILPAFGLVLAAAGPMAEPAAVVRGLQDPSPAVRRAACQGLTGASSPAALNALADCLADPVAEVRIAAAESLRSGVAAVVPYVLARLKTSRYPEVILEALPADSPAIRAPLRDYAEETMARLRAWRAASQALPDRGRVSRFLVQVIDARTLQAEQQAVKIIGLLGNQRVMQLVASTLRTANAEARATALEALDMLGDKQLVKALLPLLEAPRPKPELNGHADELLRRLIASEDELVSALAIRTAGELELKGLVPDILPRVACSSTLESEAARETLHHLGVTVETLATLSLVERTLLLREVPLFGDLLPDDLLPIAQAARERLFADGAVLCRQGEPGDELFVIAAGQVRVRREGRGPEQVLATRGGGEFVGEMAIIESAPRFATVTALGETRALVINAETFKAILRDRPEVALAVMRSLSRRLREPH